MKNIAFVGAFEPLTNTNNLATSAAGNLVQNEILDALAESNKNSNSIVSALSHKPTRSWPNGPIYVKKDEVGTVQLPAFINLPILKHLNFGIALFFFLLRTRTSLIVAYNPGPFETLALLFYRLILQKTFICSIIQDIHSIRERNISLRSLSDNISIRMARLLDLTIPVSKYIIDDFGLDSEKSIVFRGGMTKQSRELLEVKNEKLKPYAVFAGALESYNGIDLLLSNWTRLKSEITLHIFGKGSLSSTASDYANRSKTIVFHGFQNEETITRWQKTSLINFCLRYSGTINQRYFFPSKFFNSAAAPGALVANRFEGFPDDLIEHCHIVDDDLNNLPQIVESILSRGVNPNPTGLTRRREWLSQNSNWKQLIQEILNRFERHQDK